MNQKTETRLFSYKFLLQSTQDTWTDLRLWQGSCTHWEAHSVVPRIGWFVQSMEEKMLKSPVSHGTYQPGELIGFSLIRKRGVQYSRLSNIRQLCFSCIRSRKTSSTLLIQAWSLPAVNSRSIRSFAQDKQHNPTNRSSYPVQGCL